MKHFLGTAALALAIAALPAGVATAQATGTEASTQAAADSLLAADRAFAAAAAEVDLVTALSAMYADDIVVPTPQASFARGKAAATAVLRGNPANATSRASWAPLRAGVSADGRHGFTFGYMTVRQDGKPDRPLKYLSYWVKTPGGWRVAAYRRAPRPEGEVSTSPLPPALPGTAVPGSIAAHAESLAAAERGFAAEAQTIGLAAAFARWGRADAANMGSGPGFTIGAAAIGKDMPSGPSALDWGPDEGVLVAPSGDLGVTFGYIRAKSPPPAGQPDKAPFFTIWKRDGAGAPWRYIAE